MGQGSQGYLLLKSNHSVKRGGSQKRRILRQAQDDNVMVSLSNHKGTLHDTLWVCYGELVESMTAKLHPLLNGY